MNQYCSQCQTEIYLYDFNINDFFCEICTFNNKCEVITDLKDCSTIFENYQWLYEFDQTKRGTEGFLYIVFNKTSGQKTFLKVQDYYKAKDKEMIISCLVSKYPNFVKTYKCWVCDEEPIEDVWKKSKLGKKVLKRFDPDHKQKLCYIEMKIYDGSLSDILNNGTPLSYHDKVSICFELFNSMKIANDEYGFIHNDIHYGNIFYEMNNTTRIYEIETKKDESKKRITLNINCSSNFFPIWGDFGNSYVLKGKHRKYPEFDDIEEEDTEFQKKIFDIMARGFNIFDQNIDKLDKDLRNNKKTNQQVLEWLGRLVIESEEISEKKQRLKNKILI
jgi:hypothetical protein